MVAGVKLHELIDRRSLIGFALIALVKAAALVLFATGITQGISAVASKAPLPETMSWFAGIGAILLGLTAWGQGVFGRSRARAMMERERTDLVRAATSRGTAYLDGPGHLDGPGSRDAELALTATRGLDKVEGFYLQFVPALAQTAVIPLALGLVVLSQDWLSALLVVLTLPLIPIFMVLIGQHTVDNTKKSTQALLRMSQHFAELARGLPALVGLGRSKAGHESLVSISQDYRSATVKNLRVAFLSSLALELVATLSVALVAVVIGVRMVNGDLGLEVGLLVLILAPDIYNPLREVGTSYHAAQDGLEALATARAFHAETKGDEARQGEQQHGEKQQGDQHRAGARLPNAATPKNAELLENAAPRDHAAPLDYAAPLGDYLARLQELTDAADHEENASSRPAFIAVTGASGAGKSTVLAAWLENNYTKRDVLWVQQAPLFTAATLEAELVAATSEFEQAAAISKSQVVDVRLEAKPNVTGTGVAEALELFGLSGLANWHPSWLSPGEQRRLALARAAVGVRPGAVLVLDEPTAHLDGSRRQSVIDWLRRVGREHTVILASHDPDVTALAHQSVSIPTRIPAAQVDDAGSVASGIKVGFAREAAMPAPMPMSAPISAQKPAVPAQMPASVPEKDPTSRRAWRALLDLTRGARWRLVASILTGALASMAAVALSALSGWLIVRASEQPPILFLLVAIVGVRFFGLARAVLRYLQRLVSHDMVFDLQGRWRSAVWRHLSSRALSLKDKLTPAATIDALVVKVDELRDSLVRALVPLGALPIVLAAAITATAIFAPELLWVQILGLAVSVIGGLGLSIRTESRARKLQRGLRAELLTATLDTLTQRDYWRIQRRLDRELNALVELDQRARLAENSLARTTGVAAATITVIQALTAALMIPVGANTALPTTLLLTIVLMQFALIEPLVDAASSVGWWFPVLALARDIPPIEPIKPSEPSESGEPGEPTEPTEPGKTSDSNQHLGDRTETARGALEAINAVELQQVDARWGADLPLVLDAVNARVRRGDWLSVTGPSGSGKSTLLAVMMGFLQPERGAVVIDGQPRVLQPGELAPRLAWCPQEGHIFDSTIRGNLALATADVADEAAMWSALRTAGLADMVASRAGGLDASVGPAGSRLSGGERQRLAIARAVLAGADIMCLDEPSAHLDEPTARELQDHLRERLAGHGVIQITHREADLRMGDERLNLAAVRA